MGQEGSVTTAVVAVGGGSVGWGVGVVVAVGSAVAVAVGVAVAVAVGVAVAVAVGVMVGDGVAVSVGGGVAVAVGVKVAVGGMGVTVGVVVGAAAIRSSPLFPRQPNKANPNRKRYRNVLDNDGFILPSFLN